MDLETFTLSSMGVWYILRIFPNIRRCCPQDKKPYRSERETLKSRDSTIHPAKVSSSTRVSAGKQYLWSSFDFSLPHGVPAKAIDAESQRLSPDWTGCFVTGEQTPGHALIGKNWDSIFQPDSSPVCSNVKATIIYTHDT